MTRAKRARRALPLLVATGLSACATVPVGNATLTPEERAMQTAVEDALKPATEQEIALAERSDPLTRGNFWAQEYLKDPNSPETTLYYLKALRSLGSHEKLLEIAGKALPLHPDNYEIYLEAGRSLMALNKAEEAVRAFVRSADLAPQDAAAPLAGLGLAFDRIGEHEKAQEAYQIALDRAPQRITTLNNYGLSLALTGHIDTAETVLRYAAGLPRSTTRVRQNLVLILGLQGKFDEMAAVDPNAPQRTAEANRKALEDMLRPVQTYETLQTYDADVSPQDVSSNAQEMPELLFTTVKDDAMSEPGDSLAVRAPTTSAETSQRPPLRLKPRLQSSQGG